MKRLLRNDVEAEESVVSKLHGHLRDMLAKVPRTYIEFVRLCRNRQHVIAGTYHTDFLLKAGMIQESRRGYTAHDMYRDLVRTSVVGHDLQTSLLSPFKGEDDRQLVQFTDGLLADRDLVVALETEMRALYVQDPLTWAELVRLCRGQRSMPFGCTLEVLIGRGFVQSDTSLKMYATLPGAGDVAVFEVDLIALQIQDILKEFLPLMATEGKGLSLQPRDTFYTPEVATPPKTRKSAVPQGNNGHARTARRMHPHPEPHASNGHAHNGSGANSNH